MSICAKPKYRLHSSAQRSSRPRAASPLVTDTAKASIAMPKPMSTMVYISKSPPPLLSICAPGGAGPYQYTRPQGHFCLVQCQNIQAISAPSKKGALPGGRALFYRLRVIAGAVPAHLQVPVPLAAPPQQYQRRDHRQPLGDGHCQPQPVYAPEPRQQQKPDRRKTKCTSKREPRRELAV